MGDDDWEIVTELLSFYLIRSIILSSTATTYALTNRIVAIENLNASKVS